MGNPPGPTPRLDGLLGEGDLDEQQLEALTHWANERARQLVSELDASDHELGSLLRGGRPGPRREGSGLLGPLPPRPTVAPVSREDEPQDEAEEIDELEEIDDDDLELVDDAGQAGDEPSSARTVVTPEPVPEWKAALQTVHEPTGDEHQIGSTRDPVEPISTRLESEPDEISKHDIDLSDLDGDPRPT